MKVTLDLRKGAGIKLFFCNTFLRKSCICQESAKLRICRLFRSGLDGQAVPVCRKEILTPSSVSKCIFWGRMSCSIKIMSFVFHFPFQCGFPPGFPVSTLHTCVTNINNYNNKDTKLIINSNINMRILEI